EAGGVGDDLGDLAASDVGPAVEAGRAAGGAGRAGAVAVEDAPASQAADEGVEGVAGLHIHELYRAHRRRRGGGAAGRRGRGGRRLGGRRTGWDRGGAWWRRKAQHHVGRDAAGIAKVLGEGPGAPALLHADRGPGAALAHTGAVDDAEVLAP